VVGGAVSEGGYIRCASYTHARRHPMVIGRIGAWTLPFTFTLTQAVVGVLSVLFLQRTAPVWRHVISGQRGLLVYLVVPVVLGLVSSRTSVEGRTLPRAALGFLALWGGRVRGRPPVRAPWCEFRGLVLVSTGEGEQ
jgi:TcpE family